MQIVQAERRQRVEGFVLVAASAMAFSTAGLFTKGVTAEAWSVIFWRGIGAALAGAVYLLMHGRLRQEWGQMSRPAWLVVAVMALGATAFVTSFKHTTIANVALIYASAPFLAAALAWIALREAPGLQVVLASMLALTGVGIIVTGSFGGGDLLGVVLALCMTAMVAASIVAYRIWPRLPAIMPTCLSSLLLLTPALLFGAPLSSGLSGILLSLCFGLVFAFACVTLIEGARRLPAAETALISAIETPLAPIWALMLFGERPAVATLLGGGVILLAVFASQLRLPRLRSA